MKLILPSLGRYEQSSEGYDPAEKREELFHPDSRFLILYSPTSSDTPTGYCVFRFDTEETASDDDDELYDVAYWLVPSSSRVPLHGPLTPPSSQLRIASGPGWPAAGRWPSAHGSSGVHSEGVEDGQDDADRVQGCVSPFRLLLRQLTRGPARSQPRCDPILREARVRAKKPTSRDKRQLVLLLAGTRRTRWTRASLAWTTT